MEKVIDDYNQRNAFPIGLTLSLVLKALQVFMPEIWWKNNLIREFLARLIGENGWKIRRNGDEQATFQRGKMSTVRLIPK